jgi:hypothetical protein
MNELQKVNDSRFPTVDTWQTIMALSAHLSESQALPAFIKNPAQLTMVLLAGKEAGLGAIESLNSFYICNGKLTIYGSAVLTQLKRAGYSVSWGKCDMKEVSLTIKAPDGTEHKESYAMEQAIKTGQTGKEVWQKYPVNMLRWKCLGNATRFFAPETTYGHYMTEDVTGGTVETVATIEIEPETIKPPEGDNQ